MSALTEEARVRKAIAGLPARQALTELAEVLRDKPSQAKNNAVAAALDAIAATLDSEMVAIRDGLPIDSEPDTAIAIREYAVGITDDQPTGLTTYGDRLYTAIRDAQLAPGGQLLQRTVVVGPWEPGPELPTGAHWWPQKH